MHKPPAILAGPFVNEDDAIRHFISQGRWVSPTAMRRYRRGVYVLDRNPATLHLGNKAFRRRMNLRMRGAE